LTWLTVLARACKSPQAAITPVTHARLASHQCAANAQQPKHHSSRFSMTEHALTLVLHTFTPSTKSVASVTQAALNVQQPANNAQNALLGSTCLELYAWTSAQTTTTQTTKQDFVILMSFHVRLAA